MGIETKSKTIGGAKYAVTMFPARRALRMAFALSAVIGPGLGKIVDGPGSIKGLLAKDTSAINLSGLMEAITARLDDARTVPLIVDFFISTRRDDEELNEAVFDQVFSGNFGEMLQALTFVLEVNYGSFLEAMRAGRIGSRIADQAA